MRDGQVTRTESGLRITFERELAHPPDAVWDALVDPEQRAVWFFAGTLEPWSGGEVALIDSGPGVRGRVSRAEAPRLLEFTWQSEDAPHSTVRFELERREGGCRLLFSHEVDADAHPDNLLPGWHCILEDLPRHLDGLRPDPDPERWRVHHRRYSTGSPT